MSIKSEIIKFRVTPYESDILKNKVKKSNAKSVSEFCRRSVLDKSVSNIDKQMIYRFVYEIGKIGNNINQITKMAHIDGISINHIREIEKNQAILNSLANKIEKELKI